MLGKSGAWGGAILVNLGKKGAGGGAILGKTGAGGGSTLGEAYTCKALRTRLARWRSIVVVVKTVMVSIRRPMGVEAFALAAKSQEVGVESAEVRRWEMRGKTVGHTSARRHDKGGDEVACVYLVVKTSVAAAVINHCPKYNGR